MTVDPLAHVRHLPVREQIKYGAARYAYRHQNETCRREFNGVMVTVTWSNWFERVFKQPLHEYIEWCRQQNFHQHSKG